MNSYGMPNVAPNVFVKGGRFPSGGETYACPMNAAFAFPAPIFDAPLKTSIIPRNSGGVPTFTRATTATFDDWEGIVRTALSGEARFNGARRVRNHLTTSEGVPALNGAGVGSIATATAGFVAPDGTPTAWRATAALNGGVAGADTSYVDFDVGGPKDFTLPVHSVWLKNNGGGNSILLRQSSATGGYVVLIDNTWRRYTITSAAVTGIVGGMFTLGQRGNVNPGVALDFLYWHPQLEDAVGQSNVAPAEYVSNGVLAAPYHGANVNGVKYFDVTNPNVVTGSVVTVSTAAPVAIANCMYWPEGARTNQCIRSEDFGAAAWSKNAVTATILAGTAPDGNVTANKIAEDATVGVEHFVEQSGVTGTDSTTASFFVWAKAVERSWLRLCVVQRDAATVIGVFFNLTTGVVGTASGGSVGSIVAYPNGLYLCKVSAPVGTGATNPRIRMSLSPDGATLVYNGVAGSGILLWGAQFEDNVSFSSKYISTLAATVTRNADVLGYGAVVPLTGSCYAEVSSAGAGAAPVGYLTGGDNNGRLIYSNNGTTNYLASNSGGGGASVIGNSAATGTRKVASSWTDLVGRVAMTEGGVAPTIATTAGSMTVTNLTVGHRGGVEQPFAGIRNVKLWNLLPDSLLQAMTSASFSAFN